MKRRRIMPIVFTLFIAFFTAAPIGTSQLQVDATQVYQAVSSDSGIVNAADVNLRTGPATSFESIAKLKKGQKVIVMGKIGDWYTIYVSSNGNVGAIYSKYLNLDTGKTTTVASTTPAETKKVEEKVDVSKEEQAMLDLVNKARKEKGLSELAFDADLVKIARLKAEDIKNNNYFSHTSTFYGTPFDMMKKYEIKFSLAGENIAGNQTVERAVNAWMKENSNNVFNSKFSHTGIGIVDSPTYGKIFVEMFIKKAA